MNRGAQSPTLITPGYIAARVRLPARSADAVPDPHPVYLRSSTYKGVVQCNIVLYDSLVTSVWHTTCSRRSPGHASVLRVRVHERARAGIPHAEESITTCRALDFSAFTFS